MALPRSANDRLFGKHKNAHLIYPEFEVSISANIRTLRQKMEGEGDEDEFIMESKGSAVIRALVENKRCGKLTLNMVCLLSSD